MTKLIVASNSGHVQAFTVNALNHLTSGPAASYGYDTNGNLRVESSGRVFTYDDENQLVDVYKTATFRQGFDYDGLGRMRKCTNYTWSSSVWTVSSETRYVYDGRRVIQERNSSNVPTVSYTRGLDLSGSFEGAGGIGGLLARSHGYSSGSWGTHSLYHADGGGNVTMLIDASTHEEKATYKYDPYGNTLSASGDLATANIYRFSSKEWHASSGLYYYGFRFYEPNLQRWLNRDPIGERGGQNLFSFVRNQPVGLIDFWGLIDLMLLNRYKDTFLILQLEDIQFDSVLTVAGHGDPGHVEDSRYQSRFLYTPESLAKVIKAHKRYQPGMPVLLVSCHTGEDPPADRKRPDRITPPFAQRLAELLEAPVFAPVGALTGGLTVVDAQGFNGELRGFLPSIGLPASPYE